MKYLCYLIPLLGMALLLGCIGQDPVVGKWQDSNATGVTMDFARNGTIITLIDVDKTIAMAKKSNPKVDEQAIRSYAQQAGAAKANWRKEGAVYRIETEQNGGSTISYMKLENNQLVGCDQSGAVKGKGVVMTRVK